MTANELPPTLGSLLAEARARLPLPREAVILLSHALDVTAVTFYAHPELRIDDAAAKRARALIERRTCGEPVAYLVGKREFHGLLLDVSPAVLIPRPETELLVDLALARLPKDEAPTVLDLGTGSGAIALAIAHERPRAHITAVDHSAEALEVARQNASHHQLDNVTFARGDWLAPVAGERFELIVSNPPYVAAGDPHLGRGDLRFEPETALLSGADGLDALRRIIEAAPAHLDPGGWVLLEHGADQQAAVLQLLKARGFTDRRGHRDLADLPRAVSAQGK